MREAIGHGRVEFHVLQGLGHQLVPFGATAAETVHLEPLADDLLDGQARRQRRIRVLEDDLQLAAQGPELARAQPGEEVGSLPAVVAHRAGAGRKAKQAQGQGRLARAGLAHQGVGAARLDLQVDAAQGPHRFGLAVAGREGEGEVVDGEQRFHGVRGRGEESGGQSTRGGADRQQKNRARSAAIAVATPRKG